MSVLERAFISTSGKTWKKVTNKNGDLQHFADGTPKSLEAFNAATQHSKYEGENARVAVPSDKGPGYRRVEVNPVEASALGQQLNLTRSNVRGQAQQTVTIDGEQYETSVLADLNKRIIGSVGPDAVMMY